MSIPLIDFNMLINNLQAIPISTPIFLHCLLNNLDQLWKTCVKYNTVTKCTYYIMFDFEVYVDHEGCCR